MELERTLVMMDSPPAPSERRVLTRGTVVGRYLLLDRLGSGGMGVVFAAHDPELDRKIALKVLLPARARSDAGRARLLREAQALAKLAHPNIVAIHDVGTHEEQVWIAMEFVAGETLRAWAKEPTRRWPELLGVLADIARGIAAAHAAGLVHRDLKPENVMIGGDGRVRVMDFGLALGRTATNGQELGASSSNLLRSRDPGLAATDSEPRPRPDSSMLSQRLTEEGSIQGTPGYMAPEQWRGQDAEAATDQYAWSVIAWELLYGQRPFTGATVMDIARAVLKGQPGPPPSGRGVPGWLRRVIERGLAREPAQRWPTMTALLAALDRGRTRGRVQRVALAVAGVAALAGAAAGYHRWDTAQRVAACEVMGADMATVWDDAARRRLQVGFAATGLRYAATAADRVIPRLDEQVAAWTHARTEACLNADVRGVWGPDLLDRAVWCLEEREMEIEALVAEFGRADAEIVQNAVAEVASRRPSETCIDEGLLMRQPAPPQAREGARDVRARLSQATSLRLAGQYEEALEVSRAAHASTVGLDWPPITAAARGVEGAILERTGAYEDAEVVFIDAYFTASSAGAWEIAATAATHLAYIVGSRARHAEARVWAQHARMAIVHAGDPMGLMEAGRLTSLGKVHEGEGAYIEAQGLYERALAIREAAMGPDHPTVAMSLNNLANAVDAAGSHTEARRLHERALTIREKALGPNHPEVAMSLINLASALKAAGAAREARAAGERALAIYEEALGPDHHDVAVCLLYLAEEDLEAGAHAAARAYSQRALAIFEAILGPDHPNVATAVNTLASVDQALGAHAEARALLERALAIREKALGPDHPDVAKSVFHLAVEIVDATPQEALPLLERAAILFAADEGVHYQELVTSFYLARALVATGGDRARAVRLARAARDGLRDADDEPLLARVEQWLAEHDAGAAGTR